MEGHRLGLSHECRYVNDLVVHNRGWFVVPTSLYPWLACISHGLSHVGKGDMCQIVLKDAQGFKSYASIVNDA